MTIEEFIEKSELLSKPELERVRLLAYYHLRANDVQEFTVATIARWFTEINMASPNASRLRAAMTKRRMFIKGSTKSTFRLHAREIAELDLLYPELQTTSEEVFDRGEVIPQVLYKGFPGYLERLCKEVNASYEHSIYDGAAVLMRRVIEVMLILAYRNLKIEVSIRDSGGNYLLLDGIIKDAKTNSTLGLSRNTKAHLDEYRKLGNFAAHKVEYNCLKADLDRVLLDYRAALQELSYKAGLRT